MKILRHSFCDPFKPDVIELGDIESKNIISRFEQIPWNEIIYRMGKANKSDIHYSPSLEFEDKTTKHGVVVSGVGTSSLREFYVSYKRPKRVKRLFGIIETDNPEYFTDVTGQTKEDVIEILNAFVNGKYDLLDSRIK
ncbi:hypothetical protein [Rufibacter roseolus]|uniref:hypothetical protein n=1 Tax=Rufibacter roseolus TaxID=2817375 RepID=UPI001B3042B3|nr:hypothetical protein [Rufibacter roseolus]